MTPWQGHGLSGSEVAEKWQLDLGKKADYFFYHCHSRANGMSMGRMTILQLTSVAVQDGVRCIRGLRLKFPEHTAQIEYHQT